MNNTCRFCGIELHSDGHGWLENKEPNCPGNPSGPQYGHSIKTGVLRKDHG